MSQSVKVSIAIKALNEEENIANCIESILSQTANIEAEVILVDSISEDKTVEIAKQYPIRIVQFSNIEDRGCGSAAQLAYSVANGKYFYLIDGDMRMQDGFLDKAIQYLDEHSDVAGVSGKLADTSIMTSTDRKRQAEYAKLSKPQEVVSLGGGGLYRCSVIDDLGYFAHSELKACEELELGIRIKSAGWKMIRLPDVAVSHTGHNESQFNMMTRLWRNGRLKAYGYFLKSALGKQWFPLTLKSTWFVFMPVLFGILPLIALLLISGSFSLSIAGIACIWTGLFVLLSLKSKSLKSAISSISLWWLLFLAIIPAAFSRLNLPRKNLAYKELK